MKKLLAIVMAGALLVSLAACGSDPVPADDTSTQVPEQAVSAEAEVEQTETVPEEPEEESADTDSGTGEVSPEFKEAMDSYEAFFDEYVAFMKKYENSDGSDLSMLSDLSDYMTKYAETMKKIEEINEDELSVDDAAYYLEVTARITKKLAEVAE